MVGIEKILAEKNAQLVADLYADTREAGTKIEPLFEPMAVDKKAFEFSRVHTVEAPRRIEVRFVQLPNADTPICVHNGNSILVRFKQP